MRRHPPFFACGFILIVLSLVTGCAFGIKYDFAHVSADISASGRSAIAVATSDRRDYVVSGKKRPNFVGLQRGGYGNPFNVTTKSNSPLADEVTTALVASLSKRGFKAMPISVSAGDDRKAVMEKAAAAKADRILITTLNDWKSDVSWNVALEYDVTVTVYDGSGWKFGEKNIQGRENLSGGARQPVRYARTAVPAAFKEKLEELLNSTEIAPVLSPRGEGEGKR
jgi:hypothetical protein